MIRAYSAVTEMFLHSLEENQARASEASQQLSSGYRVSEASDSPGDVISILDLEARIDSAAQVLDNLTGAQTEASCADEAIQTAIDLLDQVDVIATEALGITQTTDTRAAMATQVQQLLQQMVGLSQLNVNGRYVFSGNNDQSMQYTWDDSTGTVTWNFAAEQSYQVLDIFGGSFKPAMTATEIFDNRAATDVPGGTSNPTDQNVFEAIQTLYEGLTATDLDTGTTTIEDAVSDIQSAQTWLNNCLSFYGSVENRLTESETLATNYSTMWTLQLGNIRDTDTAAAATALTAATTQQEAGMAAYTSLSQKTLFDYIR